MGYRVTAEGEILCDTAEEAISIAKKIKGGDSAQQHDETAKIPKTEEGSRWTESRFKQFLSTVKGNQKEILELLLAHPHGQTDQTLRQMLRVDSNMALAGVITGLVKNARKSGVHSSELFTREAVDLGGERAFEYKLTEAFRQIAQKVGGLSPKR